MDSIECHRMLVLMRTKFFACLYNANNGCSSLQMALVFGNGLFYKYLHLEKRKNVTHMISSLTIMISSFKVVKLDLPLTVFIKIIINVDLLNDQKRELCAKIWKHYAIKIISRVELSFLPSNFLFILWTWQSIYAYYEGIVVDDVFEGECLSVPYTHSHTCTYVLTQRIMHTYAVKE